MARGTSMPISWKTLCRTWSAFPNPLQAQGFTSRRSVAWSSVSRNGWKKFARARSPKAICRLVNSRRGYYHFLARYHPKLGRLCYLTSRLCAAIYGCTDGKEPRMLAGAKMSLEKEKDDRRSADRFPIEREVRYR